MEKTELPALLMVTKHAGVPSCRCRRVVGGIFRSKYVVWKQLDKKWRNTSMRIKARSILTMGTVLAMLSPLLLHAAEPEDIIKYRQNMMKAIGAHTAAAGAIIQGKVEYRSQLAEHARALQALTNDIPGLFPKDSDFGDTRAKDGVWTDRAEFEKRANNLKTKVTAFAKAVEAGKQPAIVASYKEMGEDCKACHKDFRKKEEE
jgi:cytochrome c556